MGGGVSAGRVAWVTGGAGGIGRAVVRRLADNGATVAVLDVSEAPAVAGARAVLRCDVGDASTLDRAAAQLVAELGPADILVNCAGVSARAPVGEMTLDAWEAVLRTNLTGAFLCTAAVIDGMRRRGWGRVVSVASGSALRPTAGTAAYAASKAGLIAMTKAVALEGAADGVTANVVAPGIGDTPMSRAAWPTDDEMLAMATASPLANPMGRLLAPEDVAAAVAWLTTDETRHLTGQTLHVNGGSLMP